MAIYKKVTGDAKQQFFQGFRPGTIPPHLEPTYRAFAMDECARETVLEAMAQNNMTPFTGTRENLKIGSVSIPPPPPAKKKKGRKRSGRKARAAQLAKEQAEAEAAESVEVVEEGPPKWVVFDDMQGAIDAGWRVR